MMVYNYCAMVQSFYALNGAWADHPTFTRARWHIDITTGDSQIGYWEWLSDRLLEEASDGAPEEPQSPVTYPTIALGSRCAYCNLAETDGAGGCCENCSKTLNVPMAEITQLPDPQFVIEVRVRLYPTNDIKEMYMSVSQEAYDKWQLLRSVGCQIFVETENAHDIYWSIVHGIYGHYSGTVEPNDAAGIEGVRLLLCSFSIISFNIWLEKQRSTQPI